MVTSVGKVLHSIAAKLSFLNICLLCLCCIMYLVCAFTGQWLVFSAFEHNQTVIKYDLHYFYPKSNLSNSDLTSVKKEWQLSLIVAKLCCYIPIRKVWIIWRTCLWWKVSRATRWNYMQSSKFLEVCARFYISRDKVLMAPLLALIFLFWQSKQTRFI